MRRISVKGISMKRIGMKRIAAVLVLVLGMAVFFGGCAGQKQADQTGETGGKQEASGFPLTIKDANGSEMTIEKKPEKIVSLSLGTDELLLSLVDRSRIKGLTEFADDPGVSNIADKVKDIPNRVTADAEKIIALQPDLVIVTSWHTKEFIQQLRDAEITVYSYKTPSDMDGQKRMVAEIAHIVGEEAKGREIVTWMDSILKEVDDRVKNLKPEEKLTVLDYSALGSTSAKGTNFDDIVTRAGLINAATKAGMEGWPSISKEKIVELNPDIILLPSWSYDKKEDPAGFAGLLKNDRSLKDVKAVKNDRIYMLPYTHMGSISQNAVLAVRDVARAAYPDLFK